MYKIYYNVAHAESTHRSWFRLNLVSQLGKLQRIVPALSNFTCRRVRPAFRPGVVDAAEEVDVDAEGEDGEEGLPLVVESSVSDSGRDSTGSKRSMGAGD